MCAGRCAPVTPAATPAERQAACKTFGTSGTLCRRGQETAIAPAERRCVRIFRSCGDVAAVAALALLDPDHHPLAVDVDDGRCGF
jgi:hypothetical protein